MISEVEGSARYPCPCCGYLVFDQASGSYEICPICWWEDDALQLEFATTLAGGANHPTLLEAQRNFSALGAHDPRFVQRARPPAPGDVRDPSWRPVDPERDKFEDSSDDACARAPQSDGALYYWRETFWRGRLLSTSKYCATVVPTIDASWLDVARLTVGRVAAGVGTPDAYVLIERDGRPILRLDAYGGSPAPFTEAISWSRFVVFGRGVQVHLIDPEQREVATYDCDFYFGHLYVYGDHLLVASASELMCFDPEGKLRWRRGKLGIDGVLVDGVRDGVVTGSGEWDPPGGWQDFRVSLTTGEDA